MKKTAATLAALSTALFFNTAAAFIKTTPIDPVNRTATEFTPEEKQSYTKTFNLIQCVRKGWDDSARNASKNRIPFDETAHEKIKEEILTTCEQSENFTFGQAEAFVNFALAKYGERIDFIILNSFPPPKP